MDEDGNWKVYNSTFVAVSSATCLNCLLAAIFTGFSLKRHYFSNYNLSIRHWIMVCFVADFFIVLMLMLALFFFAFAQAFFIVIDICTSVFVIFFFTYIQENMTFFLWKFCQANPALKHRIVMERVNRRKMFKYDYPLTEYSFFDKIEVKGLYTKYCYLIEGRGRVYYFCHKSISNFAEAHSFHRENNLIIWGYMITVPIVVILEYILELTGTITIQDFNLKSVFRVYVLVMSFWASVTIQSFARSFYSIMPFSKFERQLTTMAAIKTGFDFTSSVLRLISFKVEPFDDFETFQLVFVGLFSFQFMVLCFLQFWMMSPEQISIYSGNSLSINFAQYDIEHQLNSKAGLSSIHDSDDSRNAHSEQPHDYHKIDMTDGNDSKEVVKAEARAVKAEQDYNTFKCEERKSLFEQ